MNLGDIWGASEDKPEPFRYPKTKKMLYAPIPYKKNRMGFLQHHEAKAAIGMYMEEFFADRFKNWKTIFTVGTEQQYAEFAQAIADDLGLELRLPLYVLADFKSSKGNDLKVVAERANKLHMMRYMARWAGATPLRTVKSCFHSETVHDIRLCDHKKWSYEQVVAMYNNIRAVQGNEALK